MSAPQPRGEVLRQLIGEAKDPLRPLPDFTSRTDANGQVWPENFRYYSALGEWTTVTDRRLSDPTPIYDSLVLESLAAPRPSLWTRTEILIGFAATILFVALCCLPLVTR